MELLLPQKLLKNYNDMHICITAGGTKEPIDTVRYITNASSGKMGTALYNAAKSHTKELTFLNASDYSAKKLYEHLNKIHRDIDILIMAAAVADYTPSQTCDHKIKKNKKDYKIILEPTIDILKKLGQSKKKPFLVGFCLEEDKILISEAKRKLKEKNIDIIIANPVSTIGKEDSIATIITANNKISLPLLSKRELANIILKHVLEVYNDKISRSSNK